MHDTQDYISDIPKEEYIMSMVVNKESAMNNFLDADQVIKAEQEEIREALCRRLRGEQEARQKHLRPRGRGVCER